MGAGRKFSLAEHTERERKKAANKGKGSWQEGRLRAWHSQKAQTKTRDGEEVATIDVLLATEAPMVELAVHSFPKLITKKPKEGGKEETICFNVDYNCFEDLSVIDEQTKFDDAGNRLVPPIVCPHCLFIEWVRREIEAGNLSWTEKLFEFKADSGENRLTTIYAGGVCGKFNGWDLSEEDKEELKEAGINLRLSYRQNAVAKVKFIYCVVELKDLEKGLQATVESKSLGTQVSDIIATRQNDFGDKGDPSKNPYPFRWRFWPKREAKEMYDASYFPWSDHEEGGFKSKDEAIELARSKKIPGSFENLRRYPNVKQLRSQMEAACLIDDVPWDDIFAPVEELADEKGWVKDADEEKPEATSKASSKKRDDDVAEDDDDSDVDDTLECGACGKPVASDATECPHCGEAFVEEDEPEPAKQAAPPKKESKPPKPPKADAVVADGKKSTRGGVKGGAGRTAREGKKPKQADPDDAGGDDDPIPW